MNNEYQPQFEHDLAQAATPEDIGNTDSAEVPRDPADSLRIGLAKLYYNYSREIAKQLESGLINENKATELTAQVDRLSLADLGYEISNRIPIEMAKEIMGPNMFFGPAEVENAGIEIKEEIPAIPFNPEELERAKELGQMLIYRTSTTMKELNDTIGPKLKVEGKFGLLADTTWYEDLNFYKSEYIQPGWALVSKELTPGSTKKGYLEQSELLVEYLVNEVFKDRPLPREYQAAIDELTFQKEFIRQRLAGNSGLRFGPSYVKLQRECQKLASFKINQLFRQSPAEVIYDGLVYFQNIGERLHEYDYVWTSAVAFNDIVYTGETQYGATITRQSYSAYDLGFSFSRRGADLKS